MSAHDDREIYLRNARAEQAYEEKMQRDREVFEVTIEFDDGTTMTTMDYTRRTYKIEGLDENPGGSFIKEPYKGRKPGERVYRK